MPLLRVYCNGKVVDLSKEPKLGRPVYADPAYVYHQPVLGTNSRGRSGKVKIFTEEEIATYQAGVGIES